VTSTLKRLRIPAAVAAGAVLLAGSGWYGYAHWSVGHQAAPPPARPAAAAMSVADGAAGVPPTTTLSVTAPAGARLGAVSLAAKDGAVPGAYNARHTVWTATGQLRGGAAYQVSAETISTAAGTKRTVLDRFTTSLPDKPLTVAYLAPEAGAQVGVGQPVVVTFATPITDRAAVQQALTVASTPPQPGAWSWLSAYRVDYRPQNHWQPGTTVDVGLALDGLSDGAGRYGTADDQFMFTVGRDQETTVNLRTDEATVVRGGKAIRSFPVTGGMPGLATWGGSYAVIDKVTDLDMNSETVGLGAEYNDPDVKWDVHITYSGTYIHAAPWSAYAQGRENVSHGCIGTSNANAEWFYENSLPGDVVNVVDTTRQAAPGNGFTDWGESWTQWLQGSAVPAPASASSAVRGLAPDAPRAPRQLSAS
jgi:lipoprotein-anchoring transpeptidase ErfK/SrfK